jgi:hypothetical protein
MNLGVWIKPVADALELRAPRLYRAARRPWRVLVRRLSLSGYWETRRHMNYYREAVRLAREHVSGGDRVLDVGSEETRLLGELDGFERRVALDIRPFPPQPGVERVVADFLEYRPDGPFDLVLCLQVLEHVDAPGPFARKLLATGRVVIISVPYRWPKGLEEDHIHDPIDEAKLRSWTGADPVEVCLVTDRSRQRLIAVYRPDGV